MGSSPIEKHAQVVVQLAGDVHRYACCVAESRDSMLLLEAPAACVETPAGGAVALYWESDGTFWEQEARWLGASGDPDVRWELELCGAPHRVDQRLRLRVPILAASIRATLGGEECHLLDLTEVAFSACARGRWAVGDVLEAVVYHGSEALPGRVRVESAAELERGWIRYGVSCLDGRLKQALASVCLGVQRTEIRSGRRHRRAAQE